MTLLFCLDRGATLDRLEPVILGMSERGHAVHVWLDTVANEPAVARARAGGAHVGLTPRPAGDHWRAVMGRVWSSRDYLRTLDRHWSSLPQERHAAKSAAPAGFSAFVERTPLRYGPARRGVDALLRLVEQSPPVSMPLAHELRRVGPDLLVVSPALRWGYRQGDYQFAAATRGIRSVVISDGAADVRHGPLLRPRPSRLFVWNDDEAAAAAARDPELSNRVVVTGAVSMARWEQPVSNERRSAMRRHIGLGDADVYVLYAASDLGKVSVNEPEIVQRLEGAIAAAFSVDNFKVLVRPHPEVRSVWQVPESHATADVGALVAEAAAVVGVRTRLLAEAAIAGRPVVVLDLPDVSGGQAARLQPLLADLPSAGSIDEAVRHIKDALSGRRPGGVPERVWRPRGDPVSAIIAALEQLGSEAGPEPQRPGIAVIARPLVWAPVAVRQAAETRRRWSKESKRAARKLKDRTARRFRRRLRTISEQRLAMRAYVLGTGEDLEVLELEAARVARETVTEIARSGEPIIVGPWLSEAGFELLYWIPFVRWAKTYGNIREDRFIVLSRGGAQAWYWDIASRYVDLLSLYGVDEFRQKNDARIETQGGQKQHGRADFEREIIERASYAAGVKKAQWLHPSLMYNLFNLFWMQRAPASLVQQFTVHRKLPVPDIELPSVLPPKFVAAKFYTNASFPESADNHRFVSHVLRQLTAKHDVVLLNTGIAFDDHGEFTPAESARVHQVADRLTPQDNLRLQTRIVGAADAYVGTYGGFSYLAPLCGVNALTFFSEPSAFRHDHLDVARRVFEEIGGGRFIAARTSELQFLQTVLGAPAASVAAG